MKIKLFKKSNNFKKVKFELNLNLYWELAVCGALVMIIFAFFFGYRLFLRINQEAALPAPGINKTAPIFDKNRLEKTLNYFSDREKKSAEILNSPAPFVDPSL